MDSYVVFTLMLNAVVLQAQSQAQSQPRVTIGSKSFTESVVLGDLLTHLAANAGARVEHRSELGGTQVLWKALLAGDIDAYVDYTGTIRE
jgi:osmoprotectant transport system permease protein